MKLPCHKIYFINQNPPISLLILNLDFEKEIMTSQQGKLPPLKSPTKKSQPETEKSTFPAGTQHQSRSFVRSIEGGNTLLFGETYILPNVPKGRR